VKKITFNPLFLRFLKNASIKSEIKSLYEKRVWNISQENIE